MKWYHLGLLVMGGSLAYQSLAAGADENSSRDIHAIYGQWRLVGASGSIPVECRRATLDIDPSGMLVERTFSPHGELFSLQARTHIHRQGSLYVLDLSRVRHNGEPDCQGQSANKVMKQLPNQLEFELSGNRLFHYIAGRDQGAYLRYERVAATPLTAGTADLDGSVETASP